MKKTIHYDTCEFISEMELIQRTNVWTILVTHQASGLTIKAINGFLSHASCDASINTLIFVALILQEVFQQVQHFGHLEKRDKTSQTSAVYHVFLSFYTFVYIFIPFKSWVGMMKKKSFCKKFLMLIKA